MKNDRIKELQDFANEFNRKLKHSDEPSLILNDNLYTYSNNKTMKKCPSTLGSKNQISLNNINNDMPLNHRLNIPKPKRNVKSCKRKEKLNKDIYKNLLPWIPPHYIGNYFDNFKMLHDEHSLSSWEKVIINIYNYFNFCFHRIELVYVIELMQKKNFYHKRKISFVENYLIMTLIDFLDVEYL